MVETDGELDGASEKVFKAKGNGAFERMRKAPDSHIERMKSMYANDN